MAGEPDIFADLKRKARKLGEELASAPVVEVVGVVNPPGAGGGKFQGEKAWRLSFDFAAWRTTGGEVRATKLAVHKEVTHDELDSLVEVLLPYKVFRIRARVVEGTGAPQARLESVVGKEESDRELNEFARQLQMPVTCKDAQFGKFTLDRNVDWYVGESRWNDQPIKLTLSPDNAGSIEEALKTARILWKRQPSWDRKVQKFAVSKLLPLKNSSWLDVDEPKLTAKGFLAKMKLESITIYADGSFDFWHNDGDLFWGHSI
ncbi:MAG TPA: DUF2262 domain-containing protein [Tepidisphaeraceae bacterium]|jgi:hypothetical protein|nr:DUF2262 domain-containing protein [Tepidisphaeraceae bacterium]